MPRAAQLTRLAGVQARKQRWAWDGRVPEGQVTLLVGDGGLGKSTCALDLAARVTRGQLPGECKGEPRAIIVITAEDDLQATMLPRLAAAGADLELAYSLTMTDDDGEAGLTLPGDIDALALQVAATEAALVIIDPVVAFLDDATDSHVDKSVRRALGPLHRMAEATGCAVVGIVHVNKGMASSLTRRIGGSVGFRNAARSVLLWAPDPDAPDSTRRVLVHEKCNVGPLQDALRFQLETRDTGLVDPDSGEGIHIGAVAWLGVAEGVTAERALAPPPDQAPAGDESPRQLGTDLMLDMLEQGSASWKDITARAKDEGIAPMTMRRARDDLKHQGLIRKVKQSMANDSWRWELAAEMSTATRDTVGVSVSVETQAGKALAPGDSPEMLTVHESPRAVTVSGSPNGHRDTDPDSFGDFLAADDLPDPM